MKFIYDDGGRAASGRCGSARDCVVRSIAITANLPYDLVYRALSEGAGNERKSRGATAREGIHTQRKWFKDYMRSLGFSWTPTMGIGTGCRVHLVEGELPEGRLVVAVSRHYTAIIDGVIRDTQDPSRRGATLFSPGYAGTLPAGARLLANGLYAYEPHRCVYGYWRLTVRDEEACPNLLP